MAAETLRCGRISYTNDVPVYCGIDRGAVAFPGTLVSGVPADLNRMMLEGDLDCGPISSFFYAQHADRFALLRGVCIGSRSEVRSIYCVSRETPETLAGVPVAVTKESATGRALFEVICRLRYGFAPVYVESDDPFAEFQATGRPCVVIGDHAIDAFLSEPSHAFDLGTLWHEIADVDMVYAVWAVRREVAQRAPAAVAAVEAAMLASLGWGERNLDAAVAQAQAAIPRPAGFYDTYFRALNYRFDQEARRGLAAFFSACVRCGLLSNAPAPTDEELERV